MLPPCLPSRLLTCGRPRGRSLHSFAVCFKKSFERLECLQVIKSSSVGTDWTTHSDKEAPRTRLPPGRRCDWLKRSARATSLFHHRERRKAAGAVNTWNPAASASLVARLHSCTGLTTFLSSYSLFRHFDPTMLLSPVARPCHFLWFLASARRCAAVTSASDRLVNETRVSGPDVFASYQPSSSVPDRGSFKSCLVAVGFLAPYMKSPEVNIMVHDANPQLQLLPLQEK